MQERSVVIDKIKKLLELAHHSGGNESESIQAALKAQKLMADWDVDASELSSSEEEISQVRSQVSSSRSYFAILGSIVAQNFRCRVWLEGCGKKSACVFLGYEADASAASLVFDHLWEVMNKNANRAVRAARQNYGFTDNVYNCYCNGFCAGVRTELEKQSQALMLVVPKRISNAYAELTEGFRKASGPRSSRFHTPNVSHVYNKAKADAADAINSRRFAGATDEFLLSS